jgi:hypothetical protein
MSNPRYRLELEAMPCSSGTPVSRLRKLLKVIGWYRFRCRSVEELPPASFPATAAQAEQLQTRSGDAIRTGIGDTHDRRRTKGGN